MPEPPQFHALERKLRRGGIKPEFVERTVAELRDHFEDLVDECVACGCSPDTAERRARRALGSEQVIAGAVLDRHELKHWSQRHPLAAACGRSLVIAAALPAVPVFYCAHRGPSIARWTISAGLAAVLTGLLLLGLDALLSATH
jgi:hypothetical protein